MKNPCILFPVATCLLLATTGFSQEMFLMHLEGSPRGSTYGEAASAVSNSHRVPLLATPTSGLTKDMRGAIDYGAVKGKLEYNFESSSTSGGVTTTSEEKVTTDHTGSAINARFMAPFTAGTLPMGLLVTGGSWDLELDTRKTESVNTNSQTGMGLHGIIKPGNTTASLSIQRYTETNETISDNTYNNTRYYDKDSGSTSLNTFELGARHELAPTMSIAGTYRPKAEKHYQRTYKSAETDLGTGQSPPPTSNSEEDMINRQQTLGVAFSHAMPEEGMKVAMGIKRYFPYTTTVDEADHMTAGVTGISLAAEWLRVAGGINVAPRLGLHNHDSQNFALRSVQSGLAIIFGNLALEAGLGYTVYKFKDDDDFTWNFANGAVGLDLSL